MPLRLVLSVASALALVAGGLGASEPPAGELYELALTDRAAFAGRVTASAESDLERARALTTWFAENLDWSATDYRQRTVQEILERGAGNCAELARVTTAMFDELGMHRRSVLEINLHRESAARGERARELIAERGNRLSVFGRRHNDHVWIEIRDRESGEWFPADPSLGVIGEAEWLAARLGFEERFTLDPTSEDMLAPFAIFAADASGAPAVNRTAHYVVEGFDRLYGGRLHALPAWSEWVRLVDELDDRALAAFRGEANLHDDEARIDALAAVYERLRRELSEGAAR